MKNQILLAAAVALASFGVSAQSDTQAETMYLVKGDHVVAKYNVDEVDYITFKLPEGVNADNIRLSLDYVGKNEVTYTVNTTSPAIGYAHNIFSEYALYMTSMDLFGLSFAELDEAQKVLCLKTTLQSDAFVAYGSQSFTQVDFAQYGPYEYQRFSVMPGCSYVLCAWEVDQEQGPLDTFVYTEFSTLAPAEVNLGLDIQFARVNDMGIAFNFTGNDEITYVRTAWGMKDMMESYVEYYGLDFLMGVFGQNWSLNFLQGTGDEFEGIENATWPAYDNGEYILYAWAYDAQGNVQKTSVVYNYQAAQTSEGPKITIFSKEKREGYVSVNFEISPSNVEEAYVRMLTMNTVDDRLNMGYTLSEIATGGNAEDITSIINTAGEYTFTSTEVGEEWMTILIYAKDQEGGKTVQRIDFNTEATSDWFIDTPSHNAPAKKQVRFGRIHSNLDPSFGRVKK